MTSIELQFGEMDVNTELAKNYLESYNNTFHCHAFFEKWNINFTVENCNIFGVEYDTTELCKQSENVLESKGYSRLSDKLCDHIDLISQLEFLIREKPLQTTKLELDMVIKKLRHQLLPEENVCGSKRLLMKDDSPLIDLGCIAMVQSVDIVATGKTAILCHLLHTLFQECRISSVRIRFVKDFGNLTSSFIKNKVLSAGCIGVVTAQSDVDSAVARLLSAPEGDIFGIRHILVQESVIDRFKKAIAWKSKDSADLDIELHSYCSDVYYYEDKTYLYEYVGNPRDDLVIVEAFRTVKELMSLIECYSPFCVSLWSSDVAESNEIALGIAAPLVWVNNYGVLSEPAQISQAYYSQISSSDRNPELESAFHEVCQLQKKWAKLTTPQRRNKAINVLKTSPLNDWKIIFNESLISEPKSNNFANVTTNSVVIGINKPRNIYTVRWVSEKGVISDFVERLIDGSGFLVKFPKTESPADFDADVSIITLLSKSELPIRVIDSEGDFDAFPLSHTTRVVYTSFGTIFAN